MMENEKPILNGTMANNMEDLIFLGKQMERMRDGSQLEEDERFPDPIQFEELDNDNDEKESFKRKN
ncbi:MAG TPA: multidrug ABC transporter ATPase [Ureibacillus sp.]|nr:multidrug ABC transporter ATPase [Ureibacillus sp.]